MIPTTLHQYERQEQRARTTEIRQWITTRTAERARLMDNFQWLVGTADDLYQDIEALDQDIFAAVAALVPAVSERLDLSQQAADLERLALSQADQLGIDYHPREPGLIGGRPLYHQPHELIKCWLQRYEDWSKRGPVTPEAISAHGLQGSDQESDAPGRY